MNNVAPILYFRIPYELVKDQLLLEQVIMKDLEKYKIKHKSIKVTQNGNPLVYTKSNEDKKILIDNQLLFSQSKSCGLELNKTKLQLMVKGIDANNFKLRYNTDAMQKYTIVNAIEIKKQVGQILKLCKIELEAKANFDNYKRDRSN